MFLPTFYPHQLPAHLHSWLQTSSSPNAFTLHLLVPSSINILEWLRASLCLTSLSLAGRSDIIAVLCLSRLIRIMVLPGPIQPSSTTFLATNVNLAPPAVLSIPLLSSSTSRFLLSKSLTAAPANHTSSSTLVIVLVTLLTVVFMCDTYLSEPFSLEFFYLAWTLCLISSVKNASIVICSRKI